MSWSNAITEVFRFVNNLWTKLFVSPEDQIRKVVAIYDTMHTIIDLTAVERILIFKAHNGGAAIKPTGELYVTALYEDYIHPFSTTKANYVKYPVDKEYARMILEVIQNGRKDLVTQDMPDCMLRNVYLTEGVVCSKLFYLRQDKQSIYYMSAASSKPWPEGPHTDAILDVQLNKIRQNIK